MKHFEYEISGIDGSAAKFVGYCLDNSEEVVPDRVRPSVLVIPGGGYEMTSDREAEPIAMQFLAAGFNAFVLRYSVKPSVFPVALLEAADAMTMIREHAAEWHVDPDAIAVIGFSAGGHLAANLATSTSDDVLVAHGYDPDAVRPNGLMLAYPVITSGPLAHRGSFDSLLGERRNDSQALESVSIERHIDAKTPPAYRSRRNRAIRKHTDADRRLQESRSQHRSAPIPARRAWTVVGHCGNRMAGRQRH